VGKLRLRGTDGTTQEVVGLAVRWTLDLPETLFTAQRLQPEEGPAGWLFRGKGWGHGVGMCQLGAFGMAQRRHDYRAILEHYYPGTEIGQLRLVE
jgi:SpoIID/LytB domain protein